MFIEQPAIWLRWLYPRATWRMDKNERAVYLTFDDGPIPEATPFILKTLAEFGVHATFFMVGDNLNMASDTYETLLRQMPEKQRNVFIAISAEGEARSVKSGAFAKKYHLPSPSSVNSALKGLLEKDFITQQDDAYVVYDKFFDLWLKKYLK